jgi:hypothetical protein
MNGALIERLEYVAIRAMDISRSTVCAVRVDIEPNGIAIEASAPGGRQQTHRLSWQELHSIDRKMLAHCMDDAVRRVLM